MTRYGSGPVQIRPYAGSRSWTRSVRPACGRCGCGSGPRPRASLPCWHPCSPDRPTRAGLPWLVIEPVKAEYPGMAGRLAGLGPAGAVTVLNPADPESVPLSVNPLAPERGYPVQAHIDMVRALFLAAFDADEPFPQIISQALQRVYEEAGWDVVTGRGVPGAPVEPAIPALAQLQRAALDVIDDVGYGPELQADVRGFVNVRLHSLRVGSAGRFFEGGHPADIGELLRRHVVLAIEDVANDEDKSILVGN